MLFDVFQIDAFADTAFAGNPACVCLLNEIKDDHWLQSVAAEMNLSETAFVWRQADHFHLRWFTPVAEVQLCGHGTLAASHALWESDWLASDEDAVYQTLSGMLTAKRNGQQILLDFPANVPEPAVAPDGVLAALDVEATFVGTDGVDYLIEVESEDVVKGVKPDFQSLKELTSRGVVVTSVSVDSDFDFISRFFGPAIGIDEDPVTGSAHCMLAPHWAKRLGKTRFNAFQASPRGGKLGVELKGSRVILSGQAQTIFRGQLLI